MNKWDRKKPLHPRLIGIHFQGYTPEKNYCVPDAHGFCATCADEALRARVMQVDDARSIAMVEIDGRPAEVDVSLLEEVAVGQVLLVHGGVAIGTAEE